MEQAAGLRLHVTVVDNGSNKKEPDRFTATIVSPSNTTVYSTSGAQPLKGGNITVHR
jgi:hypothetical protein